MKNIKTQIKRFETIEKIEENQINLKDSYYWESRSVFAVEFKFNLFMNNTPQPGRSFHKVIFKKLDFEDHIIQIKEITFCEENGSAPEIVKSFEPQWVQRLWNDYLNNSMDSRSKEQFYSDYQNSIDFLNSYNKEILKNKS